MKVARILLFICLFFAGSASGQNLDSLWKQCHSGSDSLRIEAHLSLSKYYYNEDFNLDSVMHLSTEAFASALAHPYGDQLYRASNWIATVYLTKDDFPHAKLWLDSSLVFARKGVDGKNVADTYHMYAIYFGNQEMSDSSLAYLIKEAETAQQANYYSAEGAAYTFIARNYKGQGLQDQQLLYHRKALKIVDKMELSNIGSIIQVYVTCAEGYTSMNVDSSLKKVLMDSARILADSALALAIRYNRVSPRASAYYVYSQCDLYDKQYDLAASDILHALQFRNYLGGSTLTVLHASMALAQSYLGNNAVASLYLDSAKSDPYANELYYRHHIAEVAYQVYKNAGDIAKALEAHEQFKITGDSLSAIDRAKAISVIEQQFNKTQNERTIRELGQEQEITSLRNKFLTAGIIAALLIVLLLVFLYRQSIFRSKQKLLEADSRLNRSRMNPHFFFNTLSSLQTIAMEEDDRGKVSDYISKYSRIMRKTLESTFEDLVSIQDEIEYLDQYLQLQRMRLAGKFNYSITTDDTIDPDEWVIPAMIIQPFVENSIEHGFFGIDYTGLITVVFQKSDAGLTIVISDNGSAIKSNKSVKEFPSRATDITRDRLILLNARYKSNAKFEIRKNPSGTGTEVRIDLPNLAIL